MDLTEFEWLEPDRVDAVGSPANGVPFLLLKSLDDEAPVYSDDRAVKYVSAAARRKYADSGVAMPNGDFPIPDEGHLRSAIGRLGNYKGDTAKAKAHIIKRAKALGLTHLLPEDWHVTDTAKAAPSQAAGQAEAHTPDPAVAAGQTEAMHPGNGPKLGDNGQAGGYEKPEMSGNGDPEADAEGYGDTASDKTIPMGEAQSQTAALHKGGGADGRGDIAGDQGDEDLAEAESEETQTDKVHAKKRHVEGPNPSAGPDESPGSQKWEEKDAALIAQAISTLEQVGAREKAEAGAAKAGRRLSGKSEQKIRAAIQALQDLLDNTETPTSKELEDMTQDELIKLLDERDEAARRAEKAKAKKAKAKKSKKVAKGADSAPKAPAVDLDSIAKAFAHQSAEAFRAAVKPLEERLATVESQPAPMGAMLNTAGLEGQPFSSQTRGTPTESAAKEMADLRQQFAQETDPVKKAALGNEISRRALVAFENGRRTGWA